jgi:predicted RNA polymerase sigma factor
MTDDRLHRTLDALWRMESPRLVARTARMIGNIGIAEELRTYCFRRWSVGRATVCPTIRPHG